MTTRLAHPLEPTGDLGLPPLGVGLAAAALVLAIAWYAPPGRRGTPVEVGRPWRWPAWLVLGALGGVVVTAARLDADVEPFNLASVLVPYVLWPLGLVVAALLGRPRPRPHAAAGVWLAVLPVVAWSVLMCWYGPAWSPRALGWAISAYAVVTLAGCVALARAEWLARAEPVGLVAGWAALARRGQTSWTPPAGAAAVLGAVVGASVVARWRNSPSWSVVAARSHPRLALVAVAALAALAGAAVATAGERRAGRVGAPGSVAAALVPVVIALPLAGVLSRTLIALRHLPAVASDPFGRGWDLFGRAGDIVPTAPFAASTRAAVALAIAVAGHLAGAWVLARRCEGVASRLPAAYVVATSAVLSAAALTAAAPLGG